jgi:hypothetical protein
VSGFNYMFESFLISSCQGVVIPDSEVPRTKSLLRMAATGTLR